MTDSVENIVPDFLTLLQGVIDSPDIPLNVSRSYLQSDSNVKKISTYITRKVADRLEEIYKNDRNVFEQKWDNLKLFVEYGMLSDEKFCERAEKFALLKNTDEKYFSYDEYKTAIESNQTDKDGKLVYLYATNIQDQYRYIEEAKNKGYDVLLFDCQLDAHFVNLLESKFKESSFARVDSDHVDNLIKKGDVQKPDLSSDENKDLSDIFNSILPKSNNYNIQAENLGETGQPILITQSEFMRRYREMSAMGGGMNFYGELPDSYSISVNVQNPIIVEIMKEKNNATEKQAGEISSKLSALQTDMNVLDESTKDKKADEISTEEKDKKEALNNEIDSLKEQRKNIMEKFASDNKLLHQVTDLALLANNMLKGKELNDFINRSTELLTPDKK